MLREIYEERRRKKFREEVGRVVISGTFAALVGAAAGVLFAPQAGKDTRRDIAEGSRELTNRAREGAQDIADELYIRSLEAKHAAQKTVGRISDRTNEFVDQGVEKAYEFADKAKDKAEEVGDEIEEKKEELEKKAEEKAKEAKEKGKEVKEATKDLKEDLKEQNKEVKKDVKEFKDKVTK